MTKQKSEGKAGSPVGHPRWGANPAFPTWRLLLLILPSTLKAFSSLEIKPESHSTKKLSRSIEQLMVRKVGLPPLLFQSEVVECIQCHPVWPFLV